MKPLTFEQAYSKAAHLCSVAEKAPQEILDKLISWSVSDDSAAKIVAKLIKENFLNETRFAHAFVNDKVKYEHWGKIKIAFHLRNKGISDELISNTLEDVIDEEEYLSVLADLLKSKMRGMELPLAENDRAKLYRFAAQRGFESALVSRALKVIKDSSESSDD